MSSPPHTTMFALARSKLHSAVGTGRDCSLHRWVLLKNSITLPPPPTNSPTPPTATITNAVVCSASTFASVSTVPPPPDYDDEDDGYLEEDAFLFPEALDASESGQTQQAVSEAEWLDSLLESLGDDDDDDDESAVGVQVYSVVDEDDDFAGLDLTPLSSSDDLAAFDAYPPPIYPPFHPPLLRSFPGEDQDRSWYRQYRDPLPYLSYEEEEEDVGTDSVSTLPPMPEAIEDTSDDESDAPSSPLVDTPTSSYLLSPLGGSPLSAGAVNVVDPASIPLPLDEHDRARPRPQQGHFDLADSYFYPFELDPPRTDATQSHHSHHHLYNPFHQEC